MEKNISNNGKDFGLSFIPYKNTVSSISNYLNSNLFITGDHEGKICIWDLRINKAVKYINTYSRKKIK